MGGFQKGIEKPFGNGSRWPNPVQLGHMVTMSQGDQLERGAPKSLVGIVSQHSASLGGGVLCAISPPTANLPCVLGESSAE